jgi:hypothetical protein
MSVLQQFVAGAVAIGMVTALVLPGRQTVAGIDAGTRFVTGVLGTAMGTK